MPSFAARLTGWVLRTTKFAIRQYGGGPNMQKYIDASRVNEPPEPSGKSLRGVETARVDVDGRPVWRLAPEARSPKGTLLFFHGGGYVYPISPLHWGMLGRLAGEHDLEVIVPLYPLTPEHQAAEVTAWALTVYRQFVERHQGRLVIGGDDILVTDARALQTKLPSVRYDEQAGLMHDWVLFGFPEARKAHAEIASFVVGV